MSWLKKKTKVHHWVENIEHNDPYEVTDWHETFQAIGPKLVLGILVFLAVVVTKTPYPILFIGVYLLALLGDYILVRWGKWIRVGKWILILLVLYKVFTFLYNNPIPPTP